MDIKKGMKNVIYSIVGQIIILVIGIMIPRLVIVSYGSETNGLISSISTIITYLSLLEAGIGAATIQALYKPVSENNRDGINSILSATHQYYKKTGIIYLSFVCGIAAIYPLIVKNSFSYWFVSTMVLIVGLPGVINFFFQRKFRTYMETVGDNYILTNLNTITTIATSILKIVLLKLGVSILIVQFIYCFSSLVQMIYVYAYIKKRYGWINVHVKPNKSALSQKNAALVHQICGLITTSTDVVILSAFCDLFTVSIYAVYNMVFNIVGTALQSVNSSVQYILGNTYCKGIEPYKKVVRTYETCYMALTSALMLVCYICIVPFLRMYTAGSDINYVDNIFPILFFAIKILDAMRNASVNTISVSGHFDKTKQHAIIESIINLSISVCSVYWFGMEGVLFGTIIAFIYRNIVAIHYANAKILKSKSTHTIKIVCVNLMIIAMLIALSYVLTLPMDTYITFFLSAMIWTIMALIVFFIGNALADKESFRMIYSMIVKKLSRKGSKSK